MGASVGIRAGASIRAKVGFFLVCLMIQILFRKLSVSFPFWTVLSMSISDNVVEGAWRTSAADLVVGIQRRNSLLSVEHVRSEAKSSRCAGARAVYAPKYRGS